MIATLARTTKAVKRTVHIGVISDPDNRPLVYIGGNPKALAEKVARLYVIPALNDLLTRDPSYAEMRQWGDDWIADFDSLHERFGNGLSKFPPDSHFSFRQADLGTNVLPELIRRAVRAGAAEDAVNAYFRSRLIERDGSSSPAERYDTYEQTTDFRR